MRTNKSGILGLAFVAVLAACESKAPIVNVETPPPSTQVTLRLVPNALSLSPGTSGSVTAVVSGSTNQAATFSSSNTAVATVAAGATPGTATISVPAGATVGAQATITAVSTADATARDAAVVTVVAAGGGGGTGNQAPTISIQSITTGATLIPVNPNAVVGQINVTLNVDIPLGSNVNRVEVLLDNVVVPNCTQTFSSATTGEMDANSQAPVEIVCSINTGAYDPATGAVTYLNGPHSLSARLVLNNGQVGAATSQTLTFRNPNFLVANYTTSGPSATGGNGPVSVAPAGSLWNSGAVTVNVLPVIFTGTGDALARATISLTTGGTGVSGSAACSSTGNAATDPTIAPRDKGVVGGATLPFCGPRTIAIEDTDASNGLSVTFPTSGTGSVGGIEDVVTLNINGVTAAGQAGPGCVNPDPINNPVIPCAAANTGAAFFVNPLRLDNLAPRFTYVNISNVLGANRYFGNQAITASVGVAPAAGTIGASTVDYGVDRQNSPVAGQPQGTTFAAGTATGSVTAVDNTNDLAESVTSNTYLLQATSVDAVGNARTVTATNVSTIFASSAGTIPAGSPGGTVIARFGVDLTAPTTGVASGPAANSINPATTTFVLTQLDAGVGPSGFAPIPFTVRAELVNAAGTTCYDLETGLAINCATGGANADGTFNSDGTFTLAAGVQGYWRISWTLEDAAGNSVTGTTRITLIDTTAPVVGNLVVPTTITGNSSVTFLAAMTDNVDLKDIMPWIGYNENGIDVDLESPLNVIGAYGIDDGLVTQHTGSTTLNNFIRSIESTAGGTPTGTIARGTDANYLVRDVANNPTTATGNILPGVAQGIGGAGTEPTGFAGTGRPFSPATNPSPSYQITTANNTICEDTDADGCTTPTTRTVTATATGPAQTFNNPFDRVLFYYQNPSTGRWSLIGSGNVTVTDNTTLMIRTWSYTTTFDAPSGAGAGSIYNVMALGVDSSGRGLMSNMVTFTVTAD